MARTEDLSVQLLGEPRLVVEGTPIHIGSIKERSLLALLALAEGRALSVGRLVDGLWGDDPPPSAAKTLQTYVSGLRRRLPGGALETTGGGYRLGLSPDRLDASRFETLVAQARMTLEAGAAQTAIAKLLEAAQLWEGPALLGVADTAVLDAAAQRLEELRREAVEMLAESRLAAGAHAEAIAELEAAVAEEPLRERRWALLMTALYRTGRQAEALRAYQRLRAVLADELGIDPSPELASIEQSIILQSAELDWIPAASINVDPPPEVPDPVGPVLRLKSPQQPPTTSTLSNPASTASKPPSGTVTLLMSDIEGSTRLWEEHAEAMSEALHRHDDIMRAAIEASGGYVFKTVGDSFCAAFATATNALQAAEAAQRALIAEPWPVSTVLRVRMALHTGECEERDGDYFGPAVNRTARLEALAHGGQVVLSRGTADIARDNLPPGTGLRPLGTHHLKDLGRPEEVFQLDIEGLDTEFTPLRSLDNPNLLHNLPELASSFVGRETEVIELRKLIDGDARLITLTGPGGVGKTRLALQVAAELLDGSGDGVWLADLAAVSEPADVPTVLADALGLRTQPGGLVEDRLVEYLRFKTVLILFDNCEHLLDASSRLVALLLRSCPKVWMLTTSREPLGVDGEHTYRVPSLSVPDFGDADPGRDDALWESEAVRLFEARASQHDADFKLDQSNLRQIAVICRRLDGIPLAIELAASRVRTLSIAEIESRLEDRFRLLSGGQRTALPRHQTLRAMIEWSHNLLSESEQIAFRRLAVFVNGFNLETAEFVVSHANIDPEDALAIIASLVDKNLINIVTGETPRRYRLAETIRQYAQDRFLEAGAEEIAATRGAHAEGLLQLAESAHDAWMASSEFESLNMFDRDIDNMWAALDYFCQTAECEVKALRLARCTDSYWYFRGGPAKAFEFFELPLAVTATQPPSTDTASTLVTFGRSCVLLGDLSAGTTRITDGIELARQCNDLPVLSRGLSMLSSCQFIAGEQCALATANEAVELAQRAEDARSLGLALESRARVRYFGDSSTEDRHTALELSLDDARGAYRAFKSIGSLCDLASVLNDWATFEMESGEYVTARSHCDEALTLARQLNLDSEIPYVVMTKASIDICCGRFEDAVQFLLEWSSAIVRVSDIRVRPFIVLWLAVGSSGCGEDRRAAYLHGASDGLFESHESFWDPFEKVMREQDHEALRLRLGDEFAQIYERGRAIHTLDELMPLLRSDFAALDIELSPTDKQ